MCACAVKSTIDKYSYYQVQELTQNIVKIIIQKDDFFFLREKIVRYGTLFIKIMHHRTTTEIICIPKLQDTLQSQNLKRHVLNEAYDIVIRS